MRTKWAVLVGICAFALGVTSTTTDAHAGDAPRRDGDADSTRARAKERWGESATIEVRDETGTVTFAAGSSARPLQARSSDSPAAIARRFVDRNGALFGADGGSGLTQLRDDAGAPGTGRSVRYQQTFRGVPVLAGQIAVQIDANGAVVSSTGEATPRLDVDTNPAITADAARAAAVAVTARASGVDPAELTAEPELWIYDPALIGATQDIGGPRLVWRVEPRTAIGDVDRLVLVDASDGTIAFDISQREDAKYREVCDNANLVGPQTCTTPVRTEFSAPSAGDVEDAFTYAGDTYDFFAAFGRDSLDGNGLVLRSTVRYCEAGSCPYDNAFWNGAQMVYGAGYPHADDVVGHELTHGLTQFTSGLFYYADSGAINESLSDVFGELIDQANGVDPPATKWLLGESLAGGPLRNMAHPELKGDPDRVQSALYRAGLTDNRGVHHNSGINNKAAYLMTDGDTFNGQTITGIGPAKVAAIYYRVETMMLVPGSDYVDLAAMLPQACTDLIAVAVTTASDCAQVQKAVIATEMGQLPQSTFVAAPPCDSGLAPVRVQFADDMEAPTDNWDRTKRAGGMSQWNYTDDSASTGTRSMAVVDAAAPAGYATLEQKRPITVGFGSTFLRFDHSYWTDAFESSNPANNEIYDGGFVEYTTDNGVTWHDITQAGPVVNGYDGVIDANAFSQDAYEGRPVFGHASANYRSTRVDLSSLAGRSVRLRFVFVNDAYPAVAYPGWFVDNVTEYSCPTLPGPPQAVVATSADGAIDLTWQPPLDDGGSAIVNWDVIPYVGGVAQPTITTPTGAASYRVAGLTNGTAVTFEVAARNALGLGSRTSSNAATPYPAFRSMAPARVLDSRAGGATADGLFSGIGLRDAGSVTQLDIAGRVDVASDAAAVVLNVTVTEAAAPGYVTVYPCGTAPPTASNLNYGTGSTIPGLVVAKIGAGGQVCIFTQSATHLVVDVAGWFPAGSSLTSLVPARLLDSRAGQSTIDGQSAGTGKPGPTAITKVRVAGRAGVPAGAGAAVLNVTVTEPDGPGYATVYPCGTAPPTASNLNHVAGQTIANAVVTKIPTSGPDAGMVCIFTQLSTHLVVDVNGWFPAFSMPVPLVPARLLDTRPGQVTVDGTAQGAGPSSAGGVTTVPVAGRGGVPANASAVVLNVTVTGPTAPGYATVYPCGEAPPTASNLNHGTGTTIANAVFTKLGAGGAVCVFTQQQTDVVVDVTASFVD